MSSAALLVCRCSYNPTCNCPCWGSVYTNRAFFFIGSSKCRPQPEPTSIPQCLQWPSPVFSSQGKQVQFIQRLCVSSCPNREEATTQELGQVVLLRQRFRLTDLQNLLYPQGLSTQGSQTSPIQKGNPIRRD